MAMEDSDHDCDSDGYDLGSCTDVTGCARCARYARRILRRRLWTSRLRGAADESLIFGRQKRIGERAHGETRSKGKINHTSDSVKADLEIIDATGRFRRRSMLLIVAESHADSGFAGNRSSRHSMVQKGSLSPQPHLAFSRATGTNSTKMTTTQDKIWDGMLKRTRCKTGDTMQALHDGTATFGLLGCVWVFSFIHLRKALAGS